MKDKELVRVLDQVKLSREREDAILADLLREEKEAANMKENRKRRIPAAALAAAVLVVVLAGTALAAEYFGKVRIELTDNVIGAKDGYWAYGPGGTIPADSFSAEVLALCADGGGACLPFDSWSEAEEYLGIELADNAVLDQLVKAYGVQYEKTTKKGRQVKRRTQCLLTIAANTDLHLPKGIKLDSSYSKGNCSIFEYVQLLTDAVEGDYEDYKTGIGSAFRGESSFQDYVTPSGLEVTICSDVFQKRSSTYTDYMAYFIKNGAFFTVELMSHDSWPADAGIKFYDPWDTLIEILDAYE